MYPEAVPEPVLSLFPVLGPAVSSRGFYLAGGTAAALQLGHRQSVDLDFFSPRVLQPEELVSYLSGLGDLQVADTGAGTLHVYLNGVRVSFFHYEYPLIDPVMSYRGVDLAGLRDIALMKIVAISNRGARKDFIDLYVICRRVWPLAEALRALPRKFGTRYSVGHILRSLQYFEDAERDPVPRLLDSAVSWSDVKAFFRDQVRAYVSNLRLEECDSEG